MSIPGLVFQDTLAGNTELHLEIFLSPVSSDPFSQDLKFAPFLNPFWGSFEDPSGNASMIAINDQQTVFCLRYWTIRDECWVSLL